MIQLSDIDVLYDFSTDTVDRKGYNYWTNFWTDEGKENELLGGPEPSYDPDSVSKNLCLYHQALWSGEINRIKFALKIEEGNLVWYDDNQKKYIFGSDSIISSFRYKKMKNIYKKLLDNKFMGQKATYRSYIENFIHKSYTIGGMIIFPKHKNSMNQRRGCHPRIQDRIDLTLECIRLFYEDSEYQGNPLFSVLQEDSWFYRMFGSFKCYIEHFFLQDMVSEDYSKILLLRGNDNTPFDGPILPESEIELENWMEKSLEIVAKRNKRIQEYVQKNRSLYPTGADADPYLGKDTMKMLRYSV